MQVLTSLTESAFCAMQEMKLHFQEKFLKASESERKRFEYLIMALSEVRPMTANGYFDISRGTLTSMISVRNDIISISLILFKFYTTLYRVKVLSN